VPASAFAVTSRRSSTTWGVAADNPASRNRFNPMIAKATTMNPAPSNPALIIAATGRTRTARARLVNTITCRRLHRSRNTPTYGPISEYGTTSSAVPAAIANALVCRSGLNSTLPARAAWNSPSANWLDSRTPSSRRNPRTDRTARRLPESREVMMVKSKAQAA
jgi:hypothetical protein